jgi:hypothetical protein
MTKYMLNVLRTYPPQKRVLRRVAYPDAFAYPEKKLGQGFFSPAQLRWFWAHIDDLDIPYNRTQDYRRRWQTIGFAPNLIIYNESPQAVYLQDDRLQSRMARIGGWDKITPLIKSREPRLLQIGEGTAKRVIRKLDRNP